MSIRNRDLEAFLRSKFNKTLQIRKLSLRNPISKELPPEDASIARYSDFKSAPPAKKVAPPAEKVAPSAEIATPPAEKGHFLSMKWRNGVANWKVETLWNHVAEEFAPEGASLASYGEFESDRFAVGRLRCR